MVTLKFIEPNINLLEKGEKVEIISDDTTDYRWGVNPIKRTINDLFLYGIINLDKPPRPTSHEVVSYVKRILNVPKAGHSGTLDPLVTGVLPIALNRATRILDTLLLAGKEYITNMQLHKDVEEKVLLETIKEFEGEIYQRPPLRASVKRVLRKRTIYKIEVLEIKEREVLFRVKCQAGTYVRKLIHDIGQALGCGAHMKELRRTKSGPFTEETFLSTLQDLFDAYEWFKEENDERPLRNIILPMEYAVKHLPKIFVKDSAVDALCHGAPLARPGVSKHSISFNAGDTVVILTLKHELIGLGEAQVNAKDIKEMERGIIAKLKRVIMPPRTYPSKKDIKKS